MFASRWVKRVRGWALVTLIAAGGSGCATTSEVRSPPLTPVVDANLYNLEALRSAFEARGLISMETNAHEYRFIDMIDPADGRLLYKLEHEVRSLLHPGYGREFINRNPSQQGLNYIAGKDALHWTLP